MATNLFDSYETDGSADPVTLTVQVGFAQLYSTSVAVGTTPVIVRPPADGNGNYRDNFSIPIGNNINLAGTTLQLESDADILKNPAASSVTIILEGGKVRREYFMDNPATGVSAGDVIDYIAAINFI